MPDQDYTKDKSFLSASPTDQHAYLMDVDPSYAKASPEDQVQYRMHLQNQGITERNAQPLDIEKKQVGKGYITPEREAEIRKGTSVFNANPEMQIHEEKYGLGLPHVASEGWEGLKDVGRSLKSVAGDISSKRPLVFGSAEEGPGESTLHKYLIHPSEDQFRRAQEGGQSTLESIGHSVAGALPVIGPAIAGLSEQAGTGDIGGAIGRGAGQAAGAKLLSKIPDVVPKLEINPAEMGAGLAKGEVAGINVKTPKVVEGVQHTFGSKLSPEAAEAKVPAAEFQPALGNTAREVLEHAQKEGIELTRGQATNMPVARMVQAIGERSLFGADKLAEGIDRNAAAFMKSTRGFADRVDPHASGLSEESAGEAIKQAVETGKSVTHENATQGYKKIEHLMPEKVDPTSISEKWHEVRENLPTGIEEQIRAQVPRNMSAIVEDLLSGKPEGFKPTFDQAIKLRSFFRELGEAEGLPSRAQGIFRQMMKATDTAMEATAKAGKFEKEWRDGNKGWKDYVEKYGDKQSPLVRILKQADPAKITRDLLNRASAKDIEILKNEKLDSALEPLKRQVIEEVAKNKFTVGRNGLGGFSHSFLNTLFGPEGLKVLYLKADIGRRFNWQMNPSGTSNVLMAESQVAHPEPSKLGLLYGAAKMSMPRPAGSFLPDISPAGSIRPMNIPIPSAPGGGFRGGTPMPGYTPSEKAATMAPPRRSLGPEFEEQQRSHEMERNKAILRNPRATAEDRRIAQSRLKEIGKF